MTDRAADHYARLFKPCIGMLVLILGFTAVVARSLPEDRDQPMKITADKAMRDDKNGVTVYSGNVVFIQGSMHLEADTLTIHHTDEQPNEIIAEGNPAKMHQQPEADKAIVYARALIITYYRDEERVYLQKQAHVEQDGSVVDGDSIDYFIEKQLIKAESDQTREGDKVLVIIPPNAQRKQDDSGATQGK